MSSSNFSAEELMPFGREPTPPPTERLLGGNEQVQIDLDIPLADAGQMRREVGIDGNHVATVDAGSKRFLIIDVRGTGNNRDFYIIDDTFSPRKRQGFKGVLEDTPVVIGRYHHEDRFSYPSTVSRAHFEVLYKDDKLHVKNLKPTNNTSITAHLTQEAVSPQRKLSPFIGTAIRTQMADDRIQQHPNFGEKDDTAPYGYYMNHPILGRQSKSVDGGVYLGGSVREAIVVDGRSDVVRRVYDELHADVSSSFQRNETMSTAAILLRVMHKVQEVMPYNDRKAERISDEHNGDKLVGLSTYLKERAGVCRHQGLLAAYMIERLMKDGHILGNVGVERNTAGVMGGTHAWAVYRARQSGADQLVVIDPAQSFVGTKAQAIKEGRWDYRLTADDYS